MTPHEIQLDEVPISLDEPCNRQSAELSIDIAQIPNDGFWSWSWNRLSLNHDGIALIKTH